MVLSLLCVAPVDDLRARDLLGRCWDALGCLLLLLVVLMVSLFRQPKPVSCIVSVGDTAVHHVNVQACDAARNQTIKAVRPLTLDDRLLQRTSFFLARVQTSSRQSCLRRKLYSVLDHGYLSALSHESAFCILHCLTGRATSFGRAKKG